MNQKELLIGMNDKNMPKAAKKLMEETFPKQNFKKKRFWFA